MQSDETLDIQKALSMKVPLKETSTGWKVVDKITDKLVNFHIRLKFKEKAEEYIAYKNSLVEMYKDFNLKFDPLASGGNPNGNSTLDDRICMNVPWLDLVLTHKDDPKLLDAFHLLVQHEIAHKEAYIEGAPSREENKFLHRMDEVYADFRACERLGISGEYGAELMRYRYRFFKKRSSFDWFSLTPGKDYDYGTTKTDTRHPTSADRIKYLEHGSFDDKVFYDIAKKADCNSKDTIDRAKQYFLEKGMPSLKHNKIEKHFESMYLKKLGENPEKDLFHRMMIKISSMTNSLPWNFSDKERILMEKHIIDYSKKHNLDPEVGIKLRDEIEKKYEGYGLVFSVSRANGTPGGTAAFPNKVIMYQEWLDVLMDNPENKMAQLALTHSILHEVSHKEMSLNNSAFDKKAKFYSWVNEVFADMRAADKMGLSSTEAARVMESEKDLHPELNKIWNQKNSLSHPSYPQRVEFLRKGVFNETTIREIADALHFKDEDAIKYASNHYKDVMFSLSDSNKSLLPEKEEEKEENKELTPVIKKKTKEEIKKEIENEKENKKPSLKENKHLIER